MGEEKKYSIKSDFSLLAVLIIPVGVAVNFVGGQMVSLLKLPLYLDTIGTIFASMLCGPWVGALTGGLANVVIGIADPVYFAFIPVNVVMGLVTGFLARGGMFDNWWKWAVSALIMSLASILTATPIAVIVFGGITGSGTSLITAVLMQTGTDIWVAVISSDGLFQLIDRILSCLVSWCVIRIIPGRTLVKFGCGAHYLKKNDGTGSEHPGEG
ncbi:MAG: ECF transporter S component [Treponema sp.]|jgi:energy-coupling factor transport system substrate-specific component|nr:ECF transporter S component [Treponema sp.]